MNEFDDDIFSDLGGRIRTEDIMGRARMLTEQKDKNDFYRAAMLFAQAKFERNLAIFGAEHVVYEKRASTNEVRLSVLPVSECFETISVILEKQLLRGATGFMDFISKRFGIGVCISCHHATFLTLATDSPVPEKYTLRFNMSDTLTRSAVTEFVGEVILPEWVLVSGVCRSCPCSCWSCGMMLPSRPTVEMLRCIAEERLCPVCSSNALTSVKPPKLSRADLEKLTKAFRRTQQ